MSQILIIDDDIELCELLTEYLQPEGFEIACAHDGRSGVEAALAGHCSLVVLDIMLPGINGFDVLRAIRARSEIAVIMLTARGDEIDRIVGLEMGADDYLPKPFNPRELVARIRAIQRRTGATYDGTCPPPGGPGQLAVEDLVLDRRARLACLAGRQVDLTAVEFSLLEIFLRRVGEVVSREELVDAVLHRSFSPYDRSIDVHVSNLRKKLGLYTDGQERIKTVRGSGYLYAEPARAVAAAP